jgi:hypothetical protein
MSISRRIRSRFASGSRPSSFLGVERSSVTLRETSTTESHANPVVRAVGRTLPGTSAQRTPLVKGGHTRARTAPVEQTASYDRDEPTELRG